MSLCNIRNLSKSHSWNNNSWRKTFSEACRGAFNEWTLKSLTKDWKQICDRKMSFFKFGSSKKKNCDFSKKSSPMGQLYKDYSQFSSAPEKMKSESNLKLKIPHGFPTSYSLLGLYNFRLFLTSFKCQTKWDRFL